MNVLKIVCVTGITIILFILTLLFTQNKRIDSKSGYFLFIIEVFVSTYALLGYEYYGNDRYLLIVVLAYTMMLNHFFNDFDFKDKGFYKNIFITTVVFSGLEILSFVLIPIEYIFLFHAFFLIVFILIKLFASLKNEVEHYNRITLSLIIISIQVMIYINFFLYFNEIKGEIAGYLLCYNLFFTAIYYFTYINTLSIKFPENKTVEKNISEKKNNLMVEDKYQKSSIDEHAANEILEKIKGLNTSLFLNSALKSDDIARELNISKHHLSQVLNTKMGYNFNQFVNQQRIEYAEILLLNTNLDIESIALECGFASKVTFYRAFKNKHNTSPGDFRKQSAFD